MVSILFGGVNKVAPGDISITDLICFHIPPEGVRHRRYCPVRLPSVVVVAVIIKVGTLSLCFD